MATNARDSRQSVQIFDVDLFRNKLETFMRRQSNEMCEMANSKKRKLSDRWSDTEKEELELDEDYREDLIYRFGKRQCPNAASYYPLDEEDLELKEVSPLALPSPVTALAEESGHPWPFFDYGSIDAMVASAGGAVTHDHNASDSDSMDLAMRRKMSGYSEVSTTPARAEDDDSWMSLCPPLSRGSLSYSSSYNSSQSNSHPQTPVYTSDLDTDVIPGKGQVDLDVSAMAPHERNVLAALAPEKFERAVLIKSAFKQGDKALGKFAKEQQPMIVEEVEDVDMDDGEYDQVFDELMHV